MKIARTPRPKIKIPNTRPKLERKLNIPVRANFDCSGISVPDVEITPGTVLMKFIKKSCRKMSRSASKNRITVLMMSKTASAVPCHGRRFSICERLEGKSIHDWFKVIIKEWKDQ